MGSGNGLPPKFPNSAVPQKNLLKLPEHALERYRHEQLQRVQEHLNELGKQESVRNEAFNILLIEAVRGLPWQPGETIAHRCARIDGLDLQSIDDVAQRIAALKLARNFNNAKKLLAELNVKELPDYVVWSAKQAGVDLLPAPVETVVPAGPPVGTPEEASVSAGNGDTPHDA